MYSIAFLNKNWKPSISKINWHIYYFSFNESFQVISKWILCFQTKVNSKSPIYLDAVSDITLTFSFFAYKACTKFRGRIVFILSLFQMSFHFKIFRYSKACFVFSSIVVFSVTYSEDNSSKLKIFIFIYFSWWIIGWTC